MKVLVPRETLKQIENRLGQNMENLDNEERQLL